ncbi:hypothetical protein H262_11589 [Citrobacter freundii GTC 09479]|nr:hypothetical protein H262_11589 [Citrobacter freundii GTC 09479]
MDKTSNKCYALYQYLGFYLIQSFLMAYKKDYQQLEAYNLLQMLQQEGVQSLLLGIYKHQIQMKYNYDRKISQRSNHLIF